jgi:hypothetical protein
VQNEFAPASWNAAIDSKPPLRTPPPESRNALCPCGSGRRYKRCPATAGEHSARAVGASPENQRPLNCLRSDDLQANSFAGASEEAISSS